LGSSTPLFEVFEDKGAEIGKGTQSLVVTDGQAV
jgi:hypothetical protein